MKKHKIWLLLSVFMFCLLTGCSPIDYPVHDWEDYHEGKEKARIEEELYKQELFQEGYDTAMYEILGPFRDGDKYQPVYISKEIIEDLVSLDEWAVNNQYSPEEYAELLGIFYEEQSYWMTAEQKETFNKIISYVLEAHRIISHIAYDMEYQPAGNQEDYESKPSNDTSKDSEQDESKHTVKVYTKDNVDELIEFFRETDTNLD